MGTVKRILEIIVEQERRQDLGGGGGKNYFSNLEVCMSQ